MNQSNPPDIRTRKRKSRRRTVIVVIFLLPIVLPALGIAILFLYQQNMIRERETLEASIRAQGYPLTRDELAAWYPEPEGQNAVETLGEAFAQLKAAQGKNPAIAELFKF